MTKRRWMDAGRREAGVAAKRWSRCCDRQSDSTALSTQPSTPGCIARSLDSASPECASHGDAAASDL